MKCLQTLSFVFLSLLFFSACSTLKRSRTIITTTFNIDTLVKIDFGKGEIKKISSVNDTVFIENKTAIARAYVDFKSGKLNITLENKPFEVKVQVNKTVTEKKKETIKTGLTFMEKAGITLLFFIIILILVKKL